MMASGLRLKLVLIATWFLGVMAVKFMLPLLPIIALQFNAPATLVKYTITLFLFGKAAGMLLFGPLSEKYGRKIFMLLGLLLFSAGNFLAYLAPGIYYLLAARFIQGIGTSAIVLMGRTMINDNYKANKAAAVFSYVFFVAAIIISFLPFLGSLIATHFPWRYAFVIMGAYSFIIFIVSFFFLCETQPQEDYLKLSLRRIFSHYQGIISHRVFLGYVLCSIFMVAGESAFNTASPFLLITTLGASTKWFGILITFLALGHLLGTLLCGRLVKKYQVVDMMGVGVSILFASTSIMALCVNMGYTHIITIIAPMTLYFVGGGFIMTMTAVGTVTPFPKQIAISSAASLLLYFTFSALSSLVMSHLSTHTAKPVSLLIAICGLLSFLSWYYLICPSRVASQTLALDKNK